MKYYKITILKDGRECCVRNGTAADGANAVENYKLVHEQTDFLLAYPDECTRTAGQQSFAFQTAENSSGEAELIATIDGKTVGMGGIWSVGSRYKIKHRAMLGVSVDKAYHGLGIGRAIVEACIECAEKTGYSQLELDVVAENEVALSLYKKLGFVEYGRNPRGFLSRSTGWQELVLMRLELN